MVRGKEYLRFKWSHDHILHRLGVNTFNTILRLLPFEIKYGLGKRLRRNSVPYNLVQNGSIVVQVGAPLDTLHAGRSRGMYFCLLAGPTGRVIIIEPDKESIEDFAEMARHNGIQNVKLYPNAAWSDKRALRIFINDSHPASSFTEGTKEYDEKRMSAFRMVGLQAEPVDDILKQEGVKKVHLVSITTNGAEIEILKGMSGLIDAGLPYISLARTGEKYIEIMESFGYRLYSHDDRGFTFTQTKSPNKSP